MPVEKPVITWKGAHPSNFRTGRGGRALEGICLHTMVGTLAGCDSWFNTYPHIVGGQDVGPASAHYGVGRDGQVHQYVSVGDTAIANGNEAGVTPFIVRENPGVNTNELLVSIEHDDGGKPGVLLPTPVQFEASCRLAAWLWVTVILPGGATNLAIDRNHIIRHAEVAPSKRKNCPGWPEDMMQLYVNRVQMLIDGAAPAPEPVITESDLQVGIALKVLSGDYRTARDHLTKLLGE